MFVEGNEWQEPGRTLDDMSVSEQRGSRVSVRGCYLDVRIQELRNDARYAASCVLTHQDGVEHIVPEDTGLGGLAWSTRPGRSVARRRDRSSNS